MDKAKNSVTVAIKNALKKFDNFYFHVHRNPDVPSYSDEAVFVLTGTHYNSWIKPNKEKVSIEISGSIRSGHTDLIEDYEYQGKTFKKFTGVYRPEKGFWSLVGSHSYLKSAMESIPDDAELHFRVGLDAVTNDYLMKNRLHGDNLTLTATWKRGTRGYRREFLLDIYTGEHNSARFGMGG